MRKKIGILTFLIFISWFALWFLPPRFVGAVPVLADLDFGFFKIHLYGLTMALAVFVAWHITSKNAHRLELSSQKVDQGLLWVVLGGFLGARLYFILFELEYFLLRPLEIFAIWSGGISLYGAMIGGLIALWLWGKYHKLDWLRYLDLLVVSLPIAQAVGRWGNFFNQEAFGKPTDLPWAIYITPVQRPFEYLHSQYFHPTFLYEIIWNLLVFLILSRFLKKESPKGLLFGYYLVFYGVGRFLIESLRLDSVYLYGFKVDQMVSLIVVIIGSALLFKTYKAAERKI